VERIRPKYVGYGDGSRKYPVHGELRSGSVTPVGITLLKWCKIPPMCMGIMHRRLGMET
jgi:hypothetical protein